MKQTLTVTQYFLLTQQEFDNLKGKDRVPMKCYICGSHYSKNKKDALQHNKRQKSANLYCSSECLTKPTIEIINCLHCNKPFERTISNKKTKDKKFCSNSCCATYMNENRTKKERDTISLKLKKTSTLKTTSKVKKPIKEKIIKIKYPRYKKLTSDFNIMYTVLYNITHVLKTTKGYKTTCISCSKPLTSFKKPLKICSNEYFKIRMQQVHKERPYLILDRSNPESYLEKSFREYIEQKGYIKNETFEQEKQWKLSSGKRYISDFYFSKLNLIVELDGKQHEQTVEEDKIRDELIFNEFNVNTLRITHKEWVKKLKYDEIENLFNKI